MIDNEENVEREQDVIEDYTADFEKVILKSLYTSANVRNKVIPLLNTNWFRGNLEMINIIDEIIDFNTKHERIPQPLELRRLLTNHKKPDALDYFNDSMKLPDTVITEYIIEEIEDFVRSKLKWNCAQDVIRSVSGEKVADTNFADRFVEADSFNFDESIGLDYFKELDRIHEEVIKNEVLIHTGIKTLDYLMFGGLHEKTLNLILASTNIGKTLIMCSLAVNIVRQGKNVLYVTFEDSELKIGGRVTQNFGDITQAQMKAMSPAEFGKLKERLQKTYTDQLKIKEYPEGTVNAIKLKALLKELKEKKHFVPDVVFIDYIGCMIPNGRENPSLNTNTILQLISAQVRSISMELGMPIVSGLQTNRGGFESAAVKLNDVADSFASTMKADFILAVTQTPEMKEQNIYGLEVQKTRLGNNKNAAATVAVDIDKQRISDFNASSSDTQFTIDFDDADKPTTDNTTGVGMGLNEAMTFKTRSKIKTTLGDDWE